MLGRKPLRKGAPDEENADKNQLARMLLGPLPRSASRPMHNGFQSTFNKKKNQIFGTNVVGIVVQRRDGNCWREASSKFLIVDRTAITH